METDFRRPKDLGSLRAARILGTLLAQGMAVKRAWSVCAAIVAVIGAWSSPVKGETFLLSQGGRIVGELQNPDQLPRENYVVKTANGSLVTLARAQVKQVVRQRPAEIEYEKIRSRYPDTVEGQWELAEWCREQTLLSQRKTHLERVIALDPEHVRARRALGYSFVDGKWMTQKEVMTKRGYQYYKGRWRLPQEIAIVEERREVDTVEKQWVQKIDRWLGWLQSDRAEIARKSLLEIEDPLAVKGLAARLQDHANPEVRALLVQALARLGTIDATQALAACSLEDPVEEVRLSCLDHLKKKKDPAVVDFYVGKLSNKKSSSAVINRAALGLKEMGDPSAVSSLIDVLITVHKTKLPGNQPGQIGASFGQGPGGGGMGLSAGGGPKVIYQPVNNRAVLDALVALTGVNFDFDVGAWKSWYAGQKKRDTIDARRG